MSQFVLIVHLVIKPEHIDSFIGLARQHAERTVRLEPDCHRFEIIQSTEDRCKVTHYEVFETEAAFQAHTQMPHTLSFGSTIQPWIESVDMRPGSLSVSIAD